MASPHPEPYLAGAAAVTSSATECLVFEDAPSGIRSARAAGACVIGVPTTYNADEIVGSRSDHSFAGIRSSSKDLDTQAGCNCRLSQDHKRKPDKFHSAIKPNTGIRHLHHRSGASKTVHRLVPPELVQRSLGRPDGSSSNEDRKLCRSLSTM